jgi:hypothetical protein
MNYPEWNPEPRRINGLGDGLTRSGAEILAKEVRVAWLNVGYDIQTWIEVIPGKSGVDKTYGVRSELVNGMPQKGAKMVGVAASWV